MSDQRRYKVTDDRFGRLALTLREKAGLTQSEVAQAIGVSERTIRYWEDGTTFPTGANLKQLIALYLRHGGFTAGREHHEAQGLWGQADESARRRKALFDTAWFEDLLAQHPQAFVHQVPAPSPTRQPATPTPARAHRSDWGDAPNAATFYGRDQQLAELEQWVVSDRCQVVALLGIGGIGKTTLAVKLAQTVAPQFERVIWRSLRNAPPLRELLADVLRLLAEEPLPDLSQSPERNLSLLLGCLREQRCLLIIDNVETVLEAGSLAGRYRAGYEEYRQLFQRLAETVHQSCLILTSREMLSELQALEGPGEPVRALTIFGLLRPASLALLKDKALNGTPEAWESFVQHYGGNPLALKIAGATVRSLFGGDLAAFLREGPVLHHTLQQLLDDQFERLAPLERDIVTWLAVERAHATLDQLNANFVRSVARRDLLAALEALRRRSLIERGEGAAFTLQPVVLEYVSDWLVVQTAEEMIRGDLGLLTSYAIFKAQSSDYVRDSQQRMLVRPLLSRLMAHFGDSRRLEHALLQLVLRLRGQAPESHGYAGGNLVNLLVSLRGDLRGLDVSRLVLRQAYLQGVNAQDANITYADASDARFTEPIETIISMAASPDGAYLAVGSFSGQLRLWHIADGKPVWSARGHSRTAWALAFSPDSATLASGGYRGTVRLWDVVSGHCVQTFNGHRAWVRSVAFSPTEPLLASVSDDETVRIWDIDDGTCRHIWEGHVGRIWSVAFSHDGALVITGGLDGTVRVWELQSGRCLHILRRHQDGVFTVAAHPHSALIASGGEDGQINLWDAQHGQYFTTVQRRTGGLAAIAFTADGSHLAGGSQGGIVELWELNGKPHRSFVGRLHNEGTVVSAIAFTGDGLAASVSRGGSVKIWQALTGTVLRTIQGYSSLVTTLSFSPDGKLIAQGDDNGTLRVWDLAASRYIAQVHGHSGPIWALAWSSDSAVLASSGDDGHIKIWEVRNGQCLQHISQQDSITWALAFSSNGGLLASGGGERQIKLWQFDPANLESHVTVLSDTSDHIVSLTFSRSGTLLASGHRDGTVRLWDVADGRCLHTVHHSSSPVGALCFTDDEDVLLSASEGLVSWWDVAAGRCFQTALADSGRNWFKAIAFSLDARLLAAAGENRTVKVWQVDQQHGLGVSRSFKGHASQVWAVAIGPDSRTLASSDDSGTVILWDVTTGVELGRITPERPYERMQIQGVTGLNVAQRAALKALGAVEQTESGDLSRESRGSA